MNRSFAAFAAVATLALSLTACGSDPLRTIVTADNCTDIGKAVAATAWPADQKAAYSEGCTRMKAGTYQPGDRVAYGVATDIQQQNEKAIVDARNKTIADLQGKITDATRDRDEDQQRIADDKTKVATATAAINTDNATVQMMQTAFVFANATPEPTQQNPYQIAGSVSTAQAPVGNVTLTVTLGAPNIETGRYEALVSGTFTFPGPYGGRNGTPVLLNFNDSRLAPYMGDNFHILNVAPVVQSANIGGRSYLLDDINRDIAFQKQAIDSANDDIRMVADWLDGQNRTLANLNTQLQQQLQQAQTDRALSQNTVPTQP